MKPPALLGFVLITHHHPNQILRLIQRLTTMFDDPPIVCHHDFGQTALDVRLFPPNVRFVQPHHRTSWGCFSLVLAYLAGLRTLYESPDCPDWFTVLSGADYPVAPAETITADLRSADFDGFMDYELVDPLRPARAWQVECARRYLVPTAWTPFNDRFRLYAGSGWFTLNRRCVGYILEASERNPGYSLHFQECFAPDEAYFQTLLCNEPSFVLRNGNRRYVDWHKGPGSPRVLDATDLPRILNSVYHFARKFDSARDPDLYDAIDAAIGQGDRRA